MIPVVILAGGLATRMRPVTEKIPKSMIDINGNPFIYHQLRLLKDKGISHVILCLGYLGEQIAGYVGTGNNFQLQVDCFYDGDRLLGTGGAIKHIGEKLPDIFFILYGDSYLDIDYKSVETAYYSSAKNGLMTIFKNDNKWDMSNVIFKNNEIIKYNKKNKTNKMNYIDYGLGIIRKSVFASFPDNEPFDLAGVYEHLADTRQLAAYEVYERFYEIGSPAGLVELSDKLTKISNRIEV
jgi:NDP-sugar pyrophosphorylase family protein